MKDKQKGFSLVEMMVSLAILGFVMGGIFALIDTTVQRGFTEQVKVDSLQEARAFTDQFFRDASQIGYPSPTKMFNPPLLLTDSKVAQGVYSSSGPTRIQFEGDMTGNGTVQIVTYQLDSTGTLLQRNWANKIDGILSPWQTVAAGVSNTDIFSYLAADGSPALTPSSAAVIRIKLVVHYAGVNDPQTRLPITTTFQSEVTLNNQ